MTDTNRQVIREKVKAALDHCADFAGANVFTSRARKLDQHELPAILIYTPEEKVSVFNASPLEYKRTCTLKIEIAAEGGDEIEDTLDGYAKIVELSLVNHDTLDDTVCDVILTSVESELSAEGQKITGGISLTYEVTYYTKAVNSGTDEEHNPLVPFVTAATQIKHVGTLASSPSAESEDQLEQ